MSLQYSTRKLSSWCAGLELKLSSRAHLPTCERHWLTSPAPATKKGRVGGSERGRRDQVPRICYPTRLRWYTPEVKVERLSGDHSHPQPYWEEMHNPGQLLEFSPFPWMVVPSSELWCLQNSCHKVLAPEASSCKSLFLFPEHRTA